MFNKIILTVSILISLGFIFAAFNMDKSETLDSPNSTDAVTEENGIQYIKLLAKGGYTPSQIQAKANMPTLIEVETKGTYDCSSALNIPQLNYRQFLPPQGVTTIQVPEDFSDDSLDILCAMGMYRSTIDFN